MYPFNLNYYNTGVTLELGDLIDSGFNIWNFDYPVPRQTIEYNGKTCMVDFDKERLQKKIEDHYRFRQIGQETPGRWFHYFRTRMCEIMPYYVQLYEFDAKFRNIEDPLESYNLLETFEQDTTGNGKITGKTANNSTSDTGSSSESTVNHIRKFSNTPQGNIENLETHLTEGTVEDNSNSESSETLATLNASGTSEQTNEDTGKVKHTLSRKGNIGVQPLGGEVQNIRSAFINIDMMIIEELNDLFLQVY